MRLSRDERGWLTQMIEAWDEEALLEARGLIDDKLAELEEEQQQASSRPDMIETRSGRKRHSYIELKMIKGYGPYAYRRWREGGKLRSKYLGKVEDES